MKHKFLFAVLVTLGLGLPSAAGDSGQGDRFHSAATLADDGDEGQEEGKTFKGVFVGPTFANDGRVYFSVGGVHMSMAAADYPTPGPTQGKVATATGCTEDPNNPGTYFCGGLN